MKVAIPETPPFNQQSCYLANEAWNVPRLAMLSAELPVADIPLAALSLGNTVYTTNMREMVMHVRSILNADMSKPIILSENGEIMDGRHRIMRALLDGDETIKAVRFEVNPSPCRVDDE